MMNILLIILTAIFIIESIFEVRYFYQIRTIFNQSNRIEPTKRVQRIVTIETQWSWISWIFLLLLFVYQTCIPLFSSVSLPLLKHG